MEKGKIVRSRVDEVRRTGRDTSGVSFARVDRGDAIIGIARSTERLVEEAADEIAEEQAREEVAEVGARVEGAVDTVADQPVDDTVADDPMRDGVPSSVDDLPAGTADEGDVEPGGEEG
nr:DNA gyrase C-terminal beta-propeller domain-containing protein [Angustibacter aerolatus]